jgi:uncharacterized protein YraI
VAQHRHKRETNARRPKAIQVAGPIAIMATFSAVSLGVLLAPPQTNQFLASSASISSADAALVSGVVSRAAAAGSLREDVVSRSESRLKSLKVEKRETRQKLKQQAVRTSELRDKAERKAAVQAVSRAATKMWTTTELNLWSGPESDAEMLGVLDELERVLVTGRAANDRVEIVINDKSRWVSAGYLADEKPTPEPDEPTLGGDCTNGSSVSGQPNVIAIHRAVCAAFPEITSYGTYRGDGEHAQGLAIDIMVSGSRGWEVAEFVRANYSTLGVSYIIYSQNIWSVERGGEGWRSMSDRGSTTANHYDHVHVTTY